MVEVFKTDIREKAIAERIIQLLRNCLPEARINFDLFDCDNILRVEDRQVDGTAVARLLKHHGHFCEVLE